jgi:hypothetical protein
MARVKPKQLPAGSDYHTLLETKYKPLILSYHGEIPAEIIAEAVGVSLMRLQEMLRSNLYPGIGIARPCPGGTFRYECLFPLRIVEFIEGRMGVTNIISYGESG